MFFEQRETRVEDAVWMLGLKERKAKMVCVCVCVRPPVLGVSVTLMCCLFLPGKRP